MKTTMTVVFAASVVLVVVAVAFLAMLLQSHSTGLEIAIGLVANIAALITLGTSWSVYRRIAKRPG